VKRVLIVLTIAAAAVSSCVSVAQEPSISPESIEFNVPAEGSTKVEFTVYNFTGDLKISLKDMGLMMVRPQTVHVIASADGTPVVLTFYGAPS